MKKLTVGSCFSGIGGLELGLEWTGGFETKWQIEIDPYASAVLAKHWPDVKRYSDITNVSSPGYVDVICGGFPCQDISNAGQRAGISGERSGLWKELLRSICMVRPRFALVENVAALLQRGMGTVLGDLAESRYDTEWDCFPASSVGAHHQRDRVFILANALCSGGGAELGEQQSERAEVFDRSSEEMDNPIRSREPQCKGNEQNERKRFINAGKDVADTVFTRERWDAGKIKAEKDARNSTSERLPNWAGGEMEQPRPLTESERPNGREIERDFRGVAHGVSKRVDRLKCLGNAVVPQVAQRIGEMILEYEKKKPL